MIEINKKLQNYYDIHIFYCINNKEANLPNSCGGKGAELMLQQFKIMCANIPDINIRVNKSGCLGRCKLAKILVIYPESIWYHYNDLEDLQQILQEHIINKKIVTKLILENKQ
jgi:(2Fe-2S) ferredoxin